jgi:hypothetical protein
LNWKAAVNIWEEIGLSNFHCLNFAGMGYLPCVSQQPSPRVVKLGDILPVFSNFDSVLSSVKSYPLWPSLIREALLDRAISGIQCDPTEMNALWEEWCRKNEVDPAKPQHEGLSVPEMQRAAGRERRVEIFKEQTFARHLPEYFRSRKGDLDRVTLEVVQFIHHAVAEEALFRCREGEQSLEVAAHELAHRDGGEPPIKRIGPIGMGRLSGGLASLVVGSKAGAILGPKKVGHFHVVVRVIDIQNSSLDGRTRHRLLDEMLNQWLEQQMSAMTGRPPKKIILQEEHHPSTPTPPALLS